MPVGAGAAVTRVTWCPASSSPYPPRPPPHWPEEPALTTIERTLSTTAPPERVFAYRLDFRNATQWDAGTVSCERVSGDGGPGTVYRNVSELAGNTIELEYTVESVDESTFV